MTSRSIAQRERVFVWVWLPGAGEPVVAGSLTRTDSLLGGEAVLVFTYARSYRATPGAISLFPPELPLRPGTHDPSVPIGPRMPTAIHGCLRDGAPDAWGRRVLNLARAGDPEVELSELTYLAESGSDRIGALDFQDSATGYRHRGEAATLDQLRRAAELVEAGQRIPDELAAAAAHGTSIGGARPKAVLADGDRRLVAKFSSTTDTRPVVQAEAAATVLAARVGLSVPAAEVVEVDGRHVLLLERFDRGPGGTRRLVLSALTLLGQDELASRHSGYADLADTIRTGPWADVPAMLRELFARLVFNVCIGNTDDHLRNHAAFWDGSTLALTPAYDLSPQPRSTSVATHAIALTKSGDRYSQLRTCRAAAPDFHVDPATAQDLVEHTVATIRRDWPDACDAARLTSTQATSLMGREILNPYIFYDRP